MGFLELWKVSGVTTDASKSSQPFFILGDVLKHENSEDVGISTSQLLSCASLFLQLYSAFHDYFERRDQSAKSNAIKFLVAFTAYAMAKDGMEWDWEQIRKTSQGLYGSMTESPDLFRLHNSPLIQNVVHEVRMFAA
jgi:hypothetical protein